MPDGPVLRTTTVNVEVAHLTGPIRVTSLAVEVAVSTRYIVGRVFGQAQIVGNVEGTKAQAPGATVFGQVAVQANINAVRLKNASASGAVSVIGTVVPATRARQRVFIIS